MIPSVFTENYLIFVGIGMAMLAAVSFMAIAAAWMFQGKSMKKLTGPLYSTIIAVIVGALLAAIGFYLMAQPTTFLWALGVSMFVFSIMIAVTAGGLSMVCLTQEKGGKSLVQRAADAKVHQQANWYKR